MSEGARRAAWLCAGCLLFSMDARSMPPERVVDVTLELPRCSEPPYDDARLTEMLELELSVRGFRAVPQGDASASAGSFRVQLVSSECSRRSGALTLRVFDPDRRWLVQHDLPLSDIPFDARPRALALVIAEALDRSRPSAAEAPASAPLAARSPAQAPVPARSPGIAPPLTTALQLGFSAQHRTPLLRWHPFWGGELSASSTTPWENLSWLAEVGFATNTTDTRFGEMLTDWWSVGLGLDLRERGLLELAVGPRLELAYLSARPEPTSGTPELRTHALMVLWGAGGEVALPLGKSWLLCATVELAQPFRGLVLTAGRERSLSLEGWILTSAFGLVFRPER